MSAKCSIPNLKSSQAALASQPWKPDEPFELGHEVFAILFYRLAADVKDEYLAAIFFIELHGHFGSFGSVQIKTVPRGMRITSHLTGMTLSTFNRGFPACLGRAC